MIDTDIENFVKSCRICLQHKPNRKMTLQPTEFLERPWQRVGMDPFFIEGAWWRIVTDYYSRYPEMAKLTRLTATAVVTHCKSIFARNRIPEVVVSDNAPQFSKEPDSPFAAFAKEYGFKHATSSLRYPQSNGLAEAAVKVIRGSLEMTGDA